MNFGNLAPKVVTNSATKFTAKFQSIWYLGESWREASSASESELGSWMPEFEDQLDPEHYKQVYDTLKANGFTSRIKLRLVREDLLNVMFNEVLPLGVKAFLSHQLRILREESPLVTKPRARTNLRAPRKI